MFSVPTNGRACSCISPLSPGGEGPGVRGKSLPNQQHPFSGIKPFPLTPTLSPRGEGVGAVRLLVGTLNIR